MVGEVAEWSNASDLKSDVRKRTEGSNPSLSVLFVYVCADLSRNVGALQRYVTDFP